MPTSHPTSLRSLATTDSQSRQSFWQQHVYQWRESGLSKAAYCQEHSLVYHQMVYWCSKDTKQDHQPAHTVSGGFVPVRLAVTPERSTGLSIRLPNGIEIAGVDEHNLACVTELVRQL